MPTYLRYHETGISGLIGTGAIAPTDTVTVHQAADLVGHRVQHCRPDTTLTDHQAAELAAIESWCVCAEEPVHWSVDFDIDWTGRPLDDWAALRWSCTAWRSIYELDELANVRHILVAEPAPAKDTGVRQYVDTVRAARQQHEAALSVSPVVRHQMLTLDLTCNVSFEPYGRPLPDWAVDLTERAKQAVESVIEAWPEGEIEEANAYEKLVTDQVWVELPSLRTLSDKHANKMFAHATSFGSDRPALVRLPAVLALRPGLEQDLVAPGHHSRDAVRTALEVAHDRAAANDMIGALAAATG